MKPTGKRGTFLDLTGELRDQIYQQDVDRLAVDKSGDRKQSWDDSQNLGRHVVGPRRREVQNADWVLATRACMA